MKPAPSGVCGSILTYATYNVEYDPSVGFNDSITAAHIKLSTLYVCSQCAVCFFQPPPPPHTHTHTHFTAPLRSDVREVKDQEDVSQGKNKEKLI